jgi:hypothetical protein
MSIQNFERHPELANIIQWFANNVSCPGTEWNELLRQINAAITTPDVAGSDAVGFAEWIGANYVTNGPGIWSRERDMQRAVTPKYSSSQLYAKFREEHPQPAGALKIAINALQSIDAYDDVADPPFTPKQFGDIARKALGEIVTLQSQSKPIKGIYILLERLAKEGGQIVSTAGLSPLDIAQAQSCDRMYVDDNNLGFVWLPSNPQPAGASVGTDKSAMEAAALKSIENHLPGAMETLIELAKQIFTDGAAFQAAQKPAPAAVSAGTWVKGKDPKQHGIYFVWLRATNEIDGHKSSALWNGEVEEWSKEDVVAYLDESAPGIPAVKELVEALERIVKHHDINPELSTPMARHLATIAHTALAGFKRK